MTVDQIASLVIDACEAEGIEHMLTGAFAHGIYGIPRSTKDVDVVVSMAGGDPIERIITRLNGVINFDSQVHFDTLTWGRRSVGTSISSPGFKVELFELFDDPFVQTQFRRKRQMFSKQLERLVWLPTPEDVVVQKLRWGRGKDLDDARDVLVVQGLENLDLAYVKEWCHTLGTSERLSNALREIGSVG